MLTNETKSLILAAIAGAALTFAALSLKPAPKACPPGVSTCRCSDNCEGNCSDGGRCPRCPRRPGDTGYVAPKVIGPK